MSLLPFKFKSGSFCFQIPNSSLVVNSHSGTPLLLAKPREHWYAVAVGAGLPGAQSSSLAVTNSPFSSLLSSIHSEFIFCLTMSAFTCLFFSLFRKQMYSFHPHRGQLPSRGSQSSHFIPNPRLPFCTCLAPRHSQGRSVDCSQRRHTRGVVYPGLPVPLENHTAAWLEHGY